MGLGHQHRRELRGLERIAAKHVSRPGGRQGYLYARPLDADAIEVFLSARSVTNG
jgi:hypothetical protein